jgi:GntR family transcriptional regulator/MocR family aminotransferase
MALRTHALDLPLQLGERGEPIHRGLYGALRAAMLEGRIPAGSRLPSTRSLAAQLGVARGTVVMVFEQLRAEGYVEGRIGSGTRVASRLPDAWFKTQGESPTRAPGPRPPPALSRWGKSIELSSSDMPRTARPLRAHCPAVDAFPTELWGQAIARRARRDERLMLSDADVRGYAPLREAVSVYLRSSRGVTCTPEQVVILPSVQQLLDLMARLVLDPGDEVWIEDPGYRGARAMFEAVGASIVPVPVDDAGIRVDVGVKRAPKARLAYVTPSHQAPLGVTLSLDRRIALLEWAAARGSFVIEDDYDSEYRYESRPLPAMQGLDREGIVVHTGTFSKTLLPSLRLAYAVIPDRLLDRVVAAKSMIDRFTPPLQQAALADFMEAGHFGRHLRRMRELYSERRAALLDALASELEGVVTVVGASAGLDLCVRLAPGMDDRRVETELAAANVEVVALSRSALEPLDCGGLLLGFAPFSPARIRKAVAAMAAVIRRGLPPKSRAARATPGPVRAGSSGAVRDG